MTQVVHNSDRLEWLSVLQGFGMLCVVVGHAWLTQVIDDNHAFVTWLIQWIYRFHMPLFFFISGFLFYKTRVVVVGYDWFQVVKEKARRLLIPYVAFTFFAIFFKLAFSGAVSRKINIDADWLVRIVFFPFENPLQGLWFIATLFYMFLPVLLYRRLSLTRYGIAVFYFVAVLVGVFVPFGIEFACISRVAIHLQFFLLGMIFYRFSNNLFSLRVVLLFFVLAVAFDYFKMGYSVVATFWILFFVTLSGVVSAVFPRLFSSFSGYTFQIYLMSIFIQIPIRVFYSKFDGVYFLFFMLSILAGIYVPVVFSKLISLYFPRLARVPFGL